MNHAKHAIEKLLAEADVRVNGNRPWDIRIHNEHFYGAVLRGGSLAFGETYMAGWWDSDQLDELIAQLFLNKVTEKVRLTPATISLFIRAYLGNLGKRSGAFKIGRRHYDLGNDLFKRMLDEKAEKWFKEHIPTYYILIDNEFTKCTELAQWKQAAMSAAEGRKQ